MRWGKDWRPGRPSDAQELQCLVDSHREVPYPVRDVAESEQAEKADHQVPDACHQPSAGARAYARAILVEGYVAYIMHPVFDLPVSPVELQQTLWGGSIRAEAAQSVGHPGPV